MRYIVLDEFTNSRWLEEGDAPEIALRLAKAWGLDKCIEATLVEDLKRVPLIPGERTFVDVATLDGWGKGCRFEGKIPQNQVILVLIPIDA